MPIATINGGHVVIPTLPNWREFPAWERRFETAIGDATTGLEQRRTLRPRPLITLSFLVTLGSVEEREELLARLRAGMKAGKVAVPYHGRGSVLSANVTGTAVTLVAGAYTPAAGDFLFFSNGGSAWEVRTVASYGSGIITLDTAVARTYAAGGFVWPVLFGKPMVEDASLRSADIDEIRIGVAEVKSTDLANVGGFLNTPGTAHPVYNGSDVFHFDLNWSASPKESFTYDLRELSVGFGAMQFDPTEDHVVKGFEFNLQLATAAELRDFDSFTAGGRGKGFWMPSPNYTLRITGGVSATQFDIADEALTEAVGDRAGLHFEFSKPGQTTQRAKIASVADNGNGTERVTLTAALATAVDSTWQVRALEFVRLADDRERGTFIGEGSMTRSVRVVEIPNEYELDGAFADSVLHFWRMEEASGNRIDSISSLSAYLGGGTVSRVTGKIGYAIGIAGAGYLQTAFPAPFSDVQFGFFGWVKFDTLAAGNGVMSDWTGIDLSYDVSTDGTNLRFRVSVNGTTVAATVTSAVALSTGTFFFFAVWHDSVANEIAISVNNETPVRVAHSGGMNTAEIINFGVGGDGFYPYLNGALDCVGHFKGAVPSLSDLSHLYNGGVGRETPLAFPAASIEVDPVFLYHFTLESPTPVHWYFNSGERDYTAHGHTWLALPITHGSMSRSIVADREQVTLTSFHKAGNPLSLWTPYPPSAKMTVEIFEDIAGVDELQFTGRVTGVDFTGKSITARAGSWSELDRRIPGPLLQARCNNHLFDVNCGAARNDFDVAATIVSVTNEIVRVNVGGFTTSDPDYFFKGEFRHGDLTAFESRTIISGTLVGGAVWDLRLNLPIIYGLVAEACTLWPGCDGLITTCHTKFNRKLSFFGFPHIPSVNPTIQTVTAKQATGKK